mgnify:CR=1
MTVTTPTGARYYYVPTRLEMALALIAMRGMSAQEALDQVDVLLASEREKHKTQ